MALAFPVFGKLNPISNITPFTYKDGATYLEILNDLIKYVEEISPWYGEQLDTVVSDLNRLIAVAETKISNQITTSEAANRELVKNTLDYVNTIINSVNNKTGSLDIQRITLTRDSIFAPNPVWPTNHPVHFEVSQNSVGGYKLLPGSTMRGNLVINPLPTSVTRFSVIPKGDGTWEIVQPATHRDVLRAEAKPVRRPWFGARVRTGDALDGDQTFRDTYDLEREMGATFDSVSWYKAVGANTANEYRTEIKPELDKNPDRKIMYALEIWRTNPNFIKEFDEKGLMYDYLVSLFTAIREVGYMDRVYLAPFHEGNGGGNYPWEMYYPGNGNSFALYKEAFTRVVKLARSMGIECKIIQWFLTSNGGDVAPATDLAASYVGDEWVDIIGASYYNRSGATGYGATWTPPGATLRSFMRKVERFSRNNVWICECGCAKSNEYGDKGVWLSDVVKLAASGELPRLEAVHFFIVPGTTTDMRFENTEQKKRFGRAINDAKMVSGNYHPARSTRNIIPPNIAVPRWKRDWTVGAADGLVTPTYEIRNNVPDYMSGTSMRVIKGATLSTNESDLGIYHSVDADTVDFPKGSPFTMTLSMRASFDGFKVSAGVRPAATDQFVGERDIALSTQWETYTIPLATTGESITTWRMPYFMFGSENRAGWFEYTDIKLAPGHMPTPHIERVLTPRVKEAPAGALVWDCETADIWDYTLSLDTTPLTAPRGTGYDGQEILLRVRQPAGGGKKFTNGRGDRLWVSSADGGGLTITNAEYTVTNIKMRYSASADKWGIVEVIRNTFT